MTFDERVGALRGLGFSERQTRFLVTVALHSGFCLPRQYAAFAGLQYGAGVRDFFDRLVVRKLARRLTFRPDRGHVYQLHASWIYDRIGQSDNRNRRHTSPALIARKLMLLDYVLQEPGADWYATEADKLALFTTRFGLSTADLPRRKYVSLDRRAPDTVRYFVHKLPISFRPESGQVTLVYLVTEATSDPFAQFVEDHLAMLGRLPLWRIVAVGPRHSRGLQACGAALARIAQGRSKSRPIAEVDALEQYFTWREAHQRGDHSWLTDVNRVAVQWHTLRRRFAAMEYEQLFERWKLEGPFALPMPVGASLLKALNNRSGQLELHSLPIRYDRFGTRPGVS